MILELIIPGGKDEGETIRDIRRIVSDKVRQAPIATDSGERRGDEGRRAPTPKASTA
jgi:hypothetical protein